MEQWSGAADAELSEELLVHEGLTFIAQRCPV